MIGTGTILLKVGTICGLCNSGNEPPGFLKLISDLSLLKARIRLLSEHRVLSTTEKKMKSKTNP